MFLADDNRLQKRHQELFNFELTCGGEDKRGWYKTVFWRAKEKKSADVRWAKGQKPNFPGRKMKDSLL